jgi:hypothetical protein
LNGECCTRKTKYLKERHRRGLITVNRTSKFTWFACSPLILSRAYLFKHILIFKKLLTQQSSNPRRRPICYRPSVFPRNRSLRPWSPSMGRRKFWAFI